MPRISIRRCLLYLFVFFMTLLVVLNVRYKDQWFPYGMNEGFANAPIVQLQNSVGGDQGKANFQQGLKISGTPSPVIHDTETGSTSGRLWFMTDGWLRPQPAPFDWSQSRRIAHLWPHEDPSDRITQQLMFVPPDLAEVTGNFTKLKKILIYNGIGNWSPLRPGRDIFLRDKCPVDTCTITANRDEVADADAVLYKDHFTEPQLRRPSHQIWILYLLECPLHTQSFNYRKVFNWTATYRHDSDIVAPYEKFVLFDPKVKALPVRRNYAANKTRQVAWFVSNCGARNNRLQYARQLGRYIDVDIFGACGTKTCPRSQHSKCFDMLNRDYKFYLSFENSNCKDYITEKFFVNGLGHEVVPIVMGARLEDYTRAAPYHSFISVDEFESPKELAEYLHTLDTNDTLYNEYFAWKGTGEFVNTHFWCRLCALLHDKQPKKFYDNIDAWWRGPGSCVTGSWRKTKYT